MKTFKKLILASLAAGILMTGQMNAMLEQGQIEQEDLQVEYARFVEELKQAKQVTDIKSVFAQNIPQETVDFEKTFKTWYFENLEALNELRQVEEEVLQEGSIFKRGFNKVKALLNNEKVKTVLRKIEKPADAALCLAIIAGVGPFNIALPTVFVYYLAYRVLKKDIGEPVVGLVSERSPQSAKDKIKNVKETAVDFTKTNARKLGRKAGQTNVGRAISRKAQEFGISLQANETLQSLKNDCKEFLGKESVRRSARIAARNII